MKNGRNSIWAKWILGSAFLLSLIGCPPQPKATLDPGIKLEKVFSMPEVYYDLVLDALEEETNKAGDIYAPLINLKELLEAAILSGDSQEFWKMESARISEAEKGIVPKFLSDLLEDHKLIGFGADDRQDVVYKQAPKNPQEQLLANYVVVGFDTSSAPTSSQGLNPPRRIPLSSRRSLCSNSRFAAQHAIEGPVCTGILLETQPGSPKKWYILTAGHAVPDDVSDWTFQLAYMNGGLAQSKSLTGKISCRVFGGSNHCDFALIEVGSSGTNLTGYLINGNIPVLPSRKDSLLYFSHPNGLEMKYAKSESQVDWPYPMNLGAKEKYFFAHLDVSQGCSGSPVFKGTTLLGIVTAAGNVGRDFVWSLDPANGAWCETWSMVNPRGYNGTQVLRLGGVFNRVKGDAALRKLFPKGWKEAKDNPPLEKLFKLDSLFVFRNKLVQQNKGFVGRGLEWELSDTVVVQLQDSSFKVFKTSIASFLSKPLQRRLRNFTWPKEFIDPGAGTSLAFTYPAQLRNPSPLPGGQKVAALEGIGEMDIIDELPNKSQKLQQIWLADGNYVELSLGGNGDIKIRTLDGLVDIYRRQFTD